MGASEEESKIRITIMIKSGRFWRAIRICEGAFFADDSVFQSE